MILHLVYPFYVDCKRARQLRYSVRTCVCSIIIILSYSTPCIVLSGAYMKLLVLSIIMLFHVPYAGQHADSLAIASNLE